MALDYKQKYLELRSKMMENVDVSYRLGYEKGYNEGEKAAQAEAQAMQQEQMMAEQAAMGGAVDENGQPINPEEQAMMEEQGGEMPPEGMEQMPEEGMEEEAGSDLDSHIQELESLVSKGEKPSILSMRKAVDKISDLRKGQKNKFKRNQPQVTSSQKKFVDNILKKWEDEVNSDKEGNELDKIIKDSGLKLED